MAGYHPGNISHSVSVEAYIGPACHWLTHYEFGDNSVTCTVVSSSVHLASPEQHDRSSPFLSSTSCRTWIGISAYLGLISLGVSILARPDPTI